MRILLSPRLKVNSKSSGSRNPVIGALAISEVAHRADVAPTTLRYYGTGRLAWSHRRGSTDNDVTIESVLARLRSDPIMLLAGFSLGEMVLLFSDDAPGTTGKPGTR